MAMDVEEETKLKVDLIAHFADLEPLEQENVESFTAVGDLCTRPIILEYPRAVTRGKIFIFTSFYYVHGVKRCLFSTFTMTQVDGFSQIVGCRG